MWKVKVTLENHYALRISMWREWGIHSRWRFDVVVNAWRSPSVIRQAHRTPHAIRMPARTPPASDKIDAPAACATLSATRPFHNLRWVWLVLGWVTVSGFDSRGRHFISVCNQPPRSTQPSILCGMVNEYQPKGGDALRLGSKGMFVGKTVCCHI